MVQHGFSGHFGATGNPIDLECVVESETTPEGHGFLPSDPIPAVSPWLRGFSHQPAVELHNADSHFSSLESRAFISLEETGSHPKPMYP